MQITDEQQKTMAVHVKYEIDEFRNLIQESARLKATGGGDNGWVEQGARIKFIALSEPAGFLLCSHRRFGSNSASLQFKSLSGTKVIARLPGKWPLSSTHDHM